MKCNFYWPKNALKNSTENTIIANTIDPNIKQSTIIESANIKQNADTIAIHNDETAKTYQSPKLQLLEDLKQRKQNDPAVIYQNQATNFVFDDGNPDAPFMFIGEAPGEEEDLQGIPFVGRCGQLLRFFLKEAEINDFYMTNIVSFRPPNNRAPTNEEIQAMQPYIFEHIQIIQPKIVIAIGTTALKTMNIKETITNAQGKIFETDIGKVYPIYHPSYALRVTAKKKELWISLLRLTQNFI